MNRPAQYHLSKSMSSGLIALFGLFCLCLGAAYAEDVDCSMCHPDLAAKKTVHAAVVIGCTGCHTSLNVAEIPHKVLGKAPKGLSSEPPELCYGCHDMGIFSKKNVHAALMMGCTTCHNPHSSDNSFLLSASVKDLCLQCHAEVVKKPHAISGFGDAGHPVGDRTYKDKSEKQKELFCTSCHNPHSSDSIRLFQFPARAPFDICKNCHNF